MLLQSEQLGINATAVGQIVRRADFVNLAADNSDAVTENAPFRAFQADLAARCATPPEATPLSVELIDSYGLGNR